MSSVPEKEGRVSLVSAQRVGRTNDQTIAQQSGMLSEFDPRVHGVGQEKRSDHCSARDIFCLNIYPVCTHRAGNNLTVTIRSLRAAVDEYLTRVTRESRGKAGEERAATERLQEDVERKKRCASCCASYVPLWPEI